MSPDPNVERRCPDEVPAEKSPASNRQPSMHRIRAPADNAKLRSGVAGLIPRAIDHSRNQFTNQLTATGDLHRTTILAGISGVG